MKEKRCKGYCGVACVDGHCPIAMRDEYAERGYDTIDTCDNCWRYKGCEDCAFDGESICPKVGENSESN